MDLLERLSNRLSFDDVRVNNFKSCVEESNGISIVDEMRRQDAAELTVQLNSGVSAEPPLVRMLNNDHTRITELYTERGAAYLTVEVT